MLLYCVRFCLDSWIASKINLIAILIGNDAFFGLYYRQHVLVRLGYFLSQGTTCLRVKKILLDRVTSRKCLLVLLFSCRYTLYIIQKHV